jgi:hypothetical protein
LITQRQKKRNKKRKYENQLKHTHVAYAIFAILNLAHFGLHHWLEMDTKHLLGLLETIKLNSNQI